MHWFTALRISDAFARSLKREVHLEVVRLSAIGVPFFDVAAGEHGTQHLVDRLGSSHDAVKCQRPFDERSFGFDGVVVPVKWGAQFHSEIIQNLFVQAVNGRHEAGAICQRHDALLLLMDGISDGDGFRVVPHAIVQQICNLAVTEVSHLPAPRMSPFDCPASLPLFPARL